MEAHAAEGDEARSVSGLWDCVNPATAGTTAPALLAQRDVPDVNGMQVWSCSYEWSWKAGAPSKKSSGGIQVAHPA